MRIKLDENLPVTLAQRLTTLGHEADTARDEGLCGRDDATIWEAAQREGRFLVTQDLDFSDIRKFLPGKHCGILLVRMQMPGLTALENRVAGIFQNEDVSAWAGYLVIATDRKLRIRSSRE